MKLNHNVGHACDKRQIPVRFEFARPSVIAIRVAGAFNDRWLEARIWHTSGAVPDPYGGGTKRTTFTG